MTKLSELQPSKPLKLSGKSVVIDCERQTGEAVGGYPSPTLAQILDRADDTSIVDSTEQARKELAALNKIVKLAQFERGIQGPSEEMHDALAALSTIRWGSR